MDTPKPTPPRTALTVKPVSKEARTVTKRAFTPKPHLTVKPFANLREIIGSQR